VIHLPLSLASQRAEEIKEEEEALREKLAANLELGKEAYGCGEYAAGEVRVGIMKR